MEKLCIARQATDADIAHTHCMLDTKTHSEYLLPFRCNNGCSNAPQRYVRTLSVLLYMLLLKKSSLQHVLAAAEPSFG